jgi:hypothetical protein
MAATTPTTFPVLHKCTMSFYCPIILSMHLDSFSKRFLQQVLLFLWCVCVCVCVCVPAPCATRTAQSLRILISSRAWWRTPLIPALRRQRQVNFWVGGQPGLQSEFQDSQGYTEKPCLKKQNKTKQNKTKNPRILTSLAKDLSWGPRPILATYTHF